MPYQHNGVRNYREEYAKYAGKPSEIHKRVLRNRARRAALAAGRVHKGDKMDVDHIIPLSRGGSGSMRNTRVINASANRSYRRTSRGGVA
jgi:5-methylcytosine-specific restriction endonuclease McrA